MLAPARGAAQNQAMPEPIELRVDLEEADVRRGLFFTLVRHSPGLRFLPAFYALAAVGLQPGPREHADRLRAVGRVLPRMQPALE